MFWLHVGLVMLISLINWWLWVYLFITWVDRGYIYSYWYHILLLPITRCFYWYQWSREYLVLIGSRVLWWLIILFLIGISYWSHVHSVLLMFALADLLLLIQNMIIRIVYMGHCLMWGQHISKVVVLICHIHVFDTNLVYHVTLYTSGSNWDNGWRGPHLVCTDFILLVDQSCIGHMQVGIWILLLAFRSF